MHNATKGPDKTLLLDVISLKQAGKTHVWNQSGSKI